MGSRPSLPGLTLGLETVDSDTDSNIEVLSVNPFEVHFLVIIHQYVNNTMLTVDWSYNQCYTEHRSTNLFLISN